MVGEKEYLLTSQEILGGIKFAVEKGETLKDAMMSFYRAGYGKQEIEEAAKTYLEMNNPAEMDVSSRIPEKKETVNELEKKKELSATGQYSKKVGEKEVEKKEVVNGTSLVEKTPSGMPKPKTFQPLNQVGGNKTQVVQKVSEYGEVIAAPKKGKLITIILILILVFLFAILGAIVLFKSELVSFFNNLFG